MIFFVLTWYGTHDKNQKIGLSCAFFLPVPIGYVEYPRLIEKGACGKTAGFF